MADKEKNKEESDNLNTAGLTFSLFTKVGSGALLLTIIGYAASWAFVTLNSLEESMAKNTEKLEMIEKGVEKDREDRAQWKQIMIVREKTTDNEVEIRVLKKLYGHVETYRGSTPVKIKTNPPKENTPKEAEKIFDDLYKKLMERDKKKLESIEDFKGQSMQQMQMPQQQVK